jgi:hypothetical protein
VTCGATLGSIRQNGELALQQLEDGGRDLRLC